MEAMYLNVCEILWIFFFILCSYLCWRYYKFTKLFKDFPTLSIRKKLLYKLFARKYRKNIFFTSVVFRVILSLAKQFEEEGLFVIWFIQPLLFVFKEEYMKILLNDSRLIDRPVFYNIVSEATGRGLLTYSASDWKKRRKLLNPAFRLEALRREVCTLNNIARDMVRRLSEMRDEPTVDVMTILQPSTLRALCESIFGIKTNHENFDAKFQEVGTLAERLEAITVYRFTRPWMYLRNFKLLFREGRKFEKIYRSFESLAKYFAEEMVNSSSLSDSEVDRSDVQLTDKTFSHILMENYRKDPSLTLKDIQDEVQSFLFLGYISTTYAILWALFMLALHPEVQEKALEELQSITGGNDADISYSDLNKLSYLESVIKETLRIYPEAPLIARQVSEDIECGKYIIPKNTCVVFSLYLLHRDKNMFPEPEKFNPDRFYKCNLKHPWSYTPFSEGTRSCIGKIFSLIEMKIFLAHILLNFRVTSPDTREDVKIGWGITLQPEKPIRFQFTSRRTQTFQEEE